MSESAKTSDNGSARSLSEFAAAAAHDLTTPLSSILGLSQLLLEDKAPDDATRREFLSIIHLQAAHMARIVRGFQDFVLFEAGAPLILALETINTEALIAELAARFGPAASAQGIALTEWVAPNTLALKTDRGRATQVLDNLLGNALKFTPQGGSIKVTAQPGLAANFVRISVCDTGIGISQAALPHVFEHSYRVSPGEIGGTGLGLYIASKLTAALGGAIGVESTLGQGSCFWVDLPTL